MSLRPDSERRGASAGKQTAPHHSITTPKSSTAKPTATRYSTTADDLARLTLSHRALQGKYDRKCAEAKARGKYMDAMHVCILFLTAAVVAASLFGLSQCQRADRANARLDIYTHSVAETIEHEVAVALGGE